MFDDTLKAVGTKDYKGFIDPSDDFIMIEGISGESLTQLILRRVAQAFFLNQMTLLT